MKVSVCFTFLIMGGMAFNSSAQEPKQQNVGVRSEAQLKQERNFYRKTLQIDSVKAIQVSQIQGAYKTALKALSTDTSLNEAAMRTRIKELMDIKNRKLKSFLSPAQQEKIIPSTERMSAPAVEQR